MKQIIFFTFLLLSFILKAEATIDPTLPDNNTPPELEGYELVWSEEFDYTGLPNQAIWDSETGFQRNEEWQWYNGFNNTTCEEGVLKIEGRVERIPNPNYSAGSSDWKRNREYAEYTSSSITTGQTKSWLFGRYEIRAKIPTATGSWPAIWMLGIDKEWPSSGEIDIMEYYLHSGVPHIMANVAWGTATQWVAAWNGSSHRYSDISAGNPNWDNEFHIWKMDWEKDYIRIYLDDRLLNNIDLSETINADGSNPFHQPQYLLLNLALGSNGGTPDVSKFPLTYEVDYVRIYQKTADYEIRVKTPESGKNYLLKHISNYYLDIEDEEDNYASLAAPTGRANQQFKFIETGDNDGTYYLQQVASGKYLYAFRQNGLSLTDNLESVASTGKFRVLPSDDDKYVNISLGSYFIGNAEYEENTPIVYNRRNQNHRSVFFELLLATEEAGKIELINQMNEIDLFLENAVSGDQAGEFPQASLGMLENKLQETREESNKEDITQEEVDALLSELEEAFDTCLKSMIKSISDWEASYNIIHSSGLYLGAKGDNAGIFEPTTNGHYSFRFIPTNDGVDTYYLLHEATNNYLSWNSWNTTWSNYPDKKVSLAYENDIVKIKYTDNGFLGTDDIRNNSSVYSDKSGTDTKHHWTLEKTEAYSITSPWGKPTILVYSSENTLYIKGLSGEYKVSVYSTSGMLIHAEKNNTEIVSKTLPAGIYIVAVVSENVSYRTTILIN